MTPGTLESRETSDLIRLSRAIRIALPVIVVGASFINIPFALWLGPVKNIYNDMLGGQALPALTESVIHFQTGLVSMAFAIPVVALGTIFLRSPIRGIYCSGACILAVFFELMILCIAMALPFVQLDWGMSGT